MPLRDAYKKQPWKKEFLTPVPSGAGNTRRGNVGGDWSGASSAPGGGQMRTQPIGGFRPSPFPSDQGGGRPLPDRAPPVPPPVGNAWDTSVQRPPSLRRAYQNQGGQRQDFNEANPKTANADWQGYLAQLQEQYPWVNQPHQGIANWRSPLDMIAGLLQYFNNDYTQNQYPGQEWLGATFPGKY